MCVSVYVSRCSSDYCTTEGTTSPPVDNLQWPVAQHDPTVTWTYHCQNGHDPSQFSCGDLRPGPPTVSGGSENRHRPSVKDLSSEENVNVSATR